MGGTAGAAALGGESQKEAANEPAGQHDVPLNEICGLHKRGGGEEISYIRTNFAFFFNLLALMQLL